MTLQILVSAAIGLPALLLALYAIGIQYQRESLPTRLRSALRWAAGAALVLDVLLNWTLFSLYCWEWPHWKVDQVKPEWTFSDRLERLSLQTDWRGTVALSIGRVLNWIAPPGHPHIHNAVGK